MAASRTPIRTGFGNQPADAHTRRYDAPAARNISRYDAPSSGSIRRLDMPAARTTVYRAPSSHITAYRVTDARRRDEIGA